MPVHSKLILTRECGSIIMCNLMFISHKCKLCVQNWEITLTSVSKTTIGFSMLTHIFALDKV